MPNQRPGFHIYPRGFIGAIPPTRVEKMTQQDVKFAGTSIRLNVSSAADRNATPNVEVEQLYGTYIRESGDVLGFDFRERILVAALFAFGTSSFFQWIKEQEQCPSFGDMHQRFLADTVRFLMGEKRELSLENWMSLIDIEDAITPSPKYRATMENFFGSTPRELRAKMYDSNIDVIQLWCSRPNGVEDLLQTLHILFGNQ